MTRGTAVGRGAVIAAVCAGALIGWPVRGQQATGSIRGVVTTASPIEPPMLKVTADQPVCGDQVVDETLLTGPTGGVANAVIVVGGLRWSADPPAAVINNKGCLFTPHVQITRPKTAVTITSEDNVLHTTHLYDTRNRTLFNIAIPLAGIKIQRPLPYGGVMRLVCDSHNWMRGWLFVTDDMAAVTGSDGGFTLGDVPPGTYQLSVWHEKLAGDPLTVTVRAGETAETDFRLK